MIPALMAFLLPLAMPRMIIWADQNGPRPEKPYFTLKTSAVGTSPLHASPPDAAGVATYREHRLIRCEIGCYGRDAVDLTTALAMRMRMPGAALAAEALGVGLGRFEAVRDLSVLLNTSQREGRAMLEFTASVVGSLAEQVGLIEHVVLECPAPAEGHQHVISSPSAATPPPS